MSRYVPIQTMAGAEELLQMPETCTTNFVSILINGTIVELYGENERPAQEGEVPSYWTIYGRLPDGSTTWIADIQNQLLAWFVAAHLGRAMNIGVEGILLNIGPLDAAVHMMNSPGVPN